MIFTVLEDGTQRVCDHRVIEFLCAEPTKCRGPVDGLSDARWLIQVQLAEALDCGSDLLREANFNARDAQFHYRYLAVKPWVFDPVVQAAPLESVVYVACAVGGEHHKRGTVSREHAHFGDGDLEVAQDLEQIRFELVIGAVNLVDE